MTLGETALSGGVSGLISVAIPYPLDTIRCRQQANIASRTSMCRVARTLLEQSGPRVLYKGITTQLCFHVPAQALYFCTYERTSSLLKKQLPNDSILVEGLAGAWATVAGYTLWTPMDNICQRCQTSNNFQKTGWYIFKQIITNEGCRGFYIGFGTSLLAEIPMVSLFWILYERLKIATKSQFGSEWGSVSFSSLLAGTVATLLSNPIDVVKTQLQLSGSGGPQALRNVEQQSAWVFARGVIRKHSLRRLVCAGIGARLLTVVPEFVISVNCFEQVKRILCRELSIPS